MPWNLSFPKNPSRACPRGGLTVGHDFRVLIPDVCRFRHCDRRRFPRRFRPGRRPYRARGRGRTTNDRLLSLERTDVQVVVGPDALGQVLAVGRSRAHVFRFRVAATFPAHVACKIAKTPQLVKAVFVFHSLPPPYAFLVRFGSQSDPSPTHPCVFDSAAF